MRKVATALLLAGLLLAASWAQRTNPQLVENSTHDFRAGVPSSARDSSRAAKSQTDSRTCVYCHTPHTRNPKAPLWNHRLSSGVSYSVYTSSTLRSIVTQPGAADSSKLCLSCHDGTVALGNTVNNGQIPFQSASPEQKLPPTRRSYLGTNLSDDHPFAFIPSTGGTDPQVRLPPPDDPVELDSVGKIQCLSCHNPHDESRDPTELRFLVKNNSAAAICTTCHELQSPTASANPWSWSGAKGEVSDHKTKTNSYDAGTNAGVAWLGSHTGYTRVDTNACAACHRPHSAHNAARLAKGVTDEVCFQCHDGNTTTNIVLPPPNNTVRQNVRSDYTAKIYKHPATGMSQSGHDPNEAALVNSNRHAACDDCHNPHAAKGAVNPVPPPALSPALYGVKGVAADGSERDPRRGTGEAQYESEICFRCHGDSTNKPQQADMSDTGTAYGRLPQRDQDVSGTFPNYTPLRVRGNTRLEFQNMASYHPVTRPRNLPAGAQSSSADGLPSLRPYIIDAAGSSIPSRPLDSSSLISCTDCHGSDTSRSKLAGNTGVAGLHGSNEPHLLERRLVVEKPNPNYDKSTSVPYSLANYALCDKCHDISNVIYQDQDWTGHALHINQTSCSTCHDPHASNRRSLLNFDVRIVRPSQQSGRLNWTWTSTGGSCELYCHGRDHVSTTYVRK